MNGHVTTAEVSLASVAAYRKEMLQFYFLNFQFLQESILKSAKNASNKREAEQRKTSDMLQAEFNSVTAKLQTARFTIQVSFTSVIGSLSFMTVFTGI